MTSSAVNGIESVTSWFTPTVLFCIVNLVIVTIFMLNPHKKQSNLTEDEQQQQQQANQLVRVPHLLDRVKSFKLPKYGSDSIPDPINYTPIAPAEEESAHKHDAEVINHVNRSKSENKEKSEVKSTSIVRLLKKSFSEKFTAKAESPEEVEDHRPATVREKMTAFNGGDEAVDEKADDFINRFRQQLKLQRLDSILRYKEMVNRGA